MTLSPPPDTLPIKVYPTYGAIKGQSERHYLGEYPAFKPGDTFRFKEAEKIIEIINFVDNQHQVLIFNPNTSIKPSEIIDGFTNLFKNQFDLLSPELKELSSKRYHHCYSCTLRDNNTCDKQKSGKNVLTGEIKNGCGCNLAAKTKSPDSRCPLDKW